MLNAAVIIAAGRGGRLRPLTDSTPKPLIEMAGRSLIGRVISFWLSQGITKLYYSLGYRWEMILAHLMDDEQSRRSFGGCFIDTTLPGTAYWIFNPLMARFDLPILVSTADNIMKLDLRRVYEDYCKLGQPACYIVPVPACGQAGTLIEFDSSSRLVSRVSEGWHQKGLIGSGVQIINPKKIVSLTSSSYVVFQGIWAELIQRRRLYVSQVLPSAWYAIDDAAGLKKAQSDFDCEGPAKPKIELFNKVVTATP